MLIGVIVPRNIRRKFLTGFLTGFYGQSHRCDRVRVGRSGIPPAGQRAPRVVLMSDVIVQGVYYSIDNESVHRKEQLETRINTIP